MRTSTTIMLAVLLAGVVTPGRAQDVERLRIHGSNTLGARLIPVVVRDWLRDSGYRLGTERQPRLGVREIHAVRDGVPLVVEVAGDGSATGFSDIVDARAELAMSTRVPSAAERDAAWQLGDLSSPDQEFVIAIDGVVAAVHPSNPVRSLGLAQLRDVYAGRIQNWAQLGGADAPIRTLLPGANTASGEFFRERVMGARPPLASPSSPPTAAAALAADRNVIAILPLGRALPAGARALAISDGGVAVAPGRGEVLSEDYPLTRRLSLYGGQMMSALGRSLALYAVSRSGQRAVEKAGQLSVMLRPLRDGAAPDGPGAYRSAVRDRLRLPLSLRFNPAGLDTLLESRAYRDVDRLAALMALPALRGREVMLVAFADDPRGGMIPTLLSNDRADMIASLLLARGIHVSGLHGFGGTRPLRRSEGAASRFHNERVEVWLK